MKLSYCLFIIFFIFLGCDSNDKKQIESDVVNNPVYSTEVEGRIERIVNNLQVKTAFDDNSQSKSLTEQMKLYHTPGVSIAVIKDGKIDWARGFGMRDVSKKAPVDINTLFQAASVSKPIFALAAMRLKEKGVLDLDKNVNEYLKSWKIPKNGDWQAKITLRQLLSHTAGMTVHGFPGYTNTESVPSVTQILNGECPANTETIKSDALPGKDFSYSGGGLTIAQLTVGDLLNKDFPVIINEELFQPLNLKYSTYQQPLPENLSNIASVAYPYNNQPVTGKYHTYPEMAAAGLWTNPSELATMLIEIQKAVKGESVLLKKETIEEMLTPQKIANFMGIGFFLGSSGDSLRFGHGGWNEGFVSQVTAFKNIGNGAIIMVNSNEGNPLLQEIMQAIAIEYEWPDFISAPGESEIHEVKSYTGTYVDSDQKELIIQHKNNTISLTYQNQDPIQLFKTNRASFSTPHFGFYIRFEKDKLHFTQESNTTVFNKILPND